MAIPAAPPAWAMVVGGLISAGLLAAIFVQLGHTSSAIVALLAQLPPAAYAAFGLLYLTQPMADLVIYRRLWRFPLSGLAALVRKTALNEVVFDYGGELYLYLWARRRGDVANAPMAAIKDVNILSALTGSGATLILLLVAATRHGSLDLVQLLRPLLWPGIGVMAISVTVLVFARRVFSLGRQDLEFVAGVHGLRMAVAAGLTLLTWRLALPQVDPGVWVVLLAVGLLVSRIPFVTNKPLLLSNVVLLVGGPAAPFGLLLAGLAVVTLSIHLVVLGLLGAANLRHVFAAGAAGDRRGRQPSRK